MTSIQTLKNRLTICEDNYKLCSKLKSAAENENYLICKYLRKHYPNIMDEIEDYLTGEAVSEYVSSDEDNRSLQQHNERKSILEAFGEEE